MMAKNGGIAEQTLVDWITEESGFEGDRNKPPKLMKLPSGKTFRVTEITGLNNNEYLVLEVQGIRFSSG